MRQKERKEQELKEKLCPGYALFLVWPLLHLKTMHLSGISFLSSEAKIVPK